MTETTTNMDHSLPEGLSWGLHQLFDAIGRLQPLLDKTVLVSPEYLEETYGWKKSYVFLSCLLACYPLGVMMHLLPYGKSRHAFSFVSGALLLQLCWGVHWIHTPVTSFVTYALIRLCGCSATQLQVQRVVPIFVMSYLAVAHFQHQYSVTNVLGMDLYFTCSQMILTQKLYMLAYNLHDGYLLAQQSRANKKDDNDDINDNDEALKAAKSCADYALTECPSLLEFLGYAFCFSTVLVGPAFEFSQYKRACDGSLHYIVDTTNVDSDNIDTANTDNTNNTANNKDDSSDNTTTTTTKTKQLRGKSIPSNILPTLIPLIKCFFLITISSIFDRTCNYRRLISPWYFNLSTPQRLFYNWLTNFVQRLKVYFTWLFAEGACNIWYAGFDGYTPGGDSKGWTIARGADIWQLETCDSIKCGTKAWNKKTSQWLLRYVYIRNKSRLGIVYAVSAIWHGFYPGYYMLASVIWLMSQCERLGRKKISPYFSEKKWSIYGVTCILTIHALGSYSTTAFFLRSKENVMENWRSHHFWGHIACLIFYTVVSQLPFPTPVPQQRPVSKTLATAAKDLPGKDTPAPPLQPESIEIETKIEAHRLRIKYS